MPCTTPASTSISCKTTNRSRRPPARCAGCITKPRHTPKTSSCELSTDRSSILRSTFAGPRPPSDSTSRSDSLLTTPTSSSFPSDSLTASARSNPTCGLPTRSAASMRRLRTCNPLGRPRPRHRLAAPVRRPDAVWQGRNRPAPGRPARPLLTPAQLAPRRDKAPGSTHKRVNSGAERGRLVSGPCWGACHGLPSNDGGGPCACWSSST